MTRRARRYEDDRKLNVKKIIAVIVLLLVIIMFFVGIKFLLESSEIWSAKYVSELNPNSIANILSYFSLKILSILFVQFP